MKMLGLCGGATDRLECCCPCHSNERKKLLYCFLVFYLTLRKDYSHEAIDSSTQNSDYDFCSEVKHNDGKINDFKLTKSAKKKI